MPQEDVARTPRRDVTAVHRGSIVTLCCAICDELYRGPLGEIHGSTRLRGGVANGDIGRSPVEIDAVD